MQRNVSAGGRDNGDPVQIVDLRREPPERRKVLLQAFDKSIYRAAFPDESIREDPEVWLRSMSDDPGPPWPIVAPLLALDDGGEVKGAVVIERYREANAGFLTYLLVAPDMRRTGLGRRLAEAAAGLLRAESETGEQPIMFAEAERPELVEDGSEKAVAVERLRILGSLGALAADLDYVQPPLAPGRASHRLLLLAAEETLPDDGMAPGIKVLAFLDELYRALGHDPSTNADYAAMASEIGRAGAVAFRPLTMIKG